MLKAYASYFVSYLLKNLKSLENIKRIILYGSVARDEANKNSDVDIFIEVEKKTKKFEDEIKSLEEEFYKGRESSLFKSRDIENKFSVKIGNLKNWRDLYKDIASTGIVLYGRYEATELPSGVKHFIIIFWNKIKINRGAFLNKIYGFKVREKYYPGLLSKYDGKKLGKSCIMLPIEYKEDIFKLLKEYKVEARIIEVFS